MSAPYPKGSAHSWEENRDGSRARLDKIGIVIRTGGVEDCRPRVPKCDGYLFVGTGGPFDFHGRSGISAGAAGTGVRRAGTSETRTPASSMSGRTTGSAGTCRRP